MIGPIGGKPTHPFRLATDADLKRPDRRLAITEPPECTCDDDSEEMCAACVRESALDAGIPESVVDGKTKLSDHFSQEYVAHKSGKGGAE